MEYIYGVLLLHQLKKEITEENLKKVLESAGAKIDESKIKAVIAALSDVNIEEAIKEQAIAVAAAPTEKAEVKEEKKEKEEKVSEEEAAQGLGALFG
jgi:large subunit ribosomal protein L12